jgi:hypothetical protein
VFIIRACLRKNKLRTVAKVDYRTPFSPWPAIFLLLLVNLLVTENRG